MAMRVLLSAFTLPDAQIWKISLSYCKPVLERYGVSFANSEPKIVILDILGSIHDAFML